MVYLKEHRIRAGLTRAQVASAFGVLVPAIYKWENNITCPSLRDVERLAEIYGILPGEIFDRPGQRARTADSIARILVFSKIKGLSPAAWLHVDEDEGRIAEAELLSRLIEVWSCLDEPCRGHLIATADILLSLQKNSGIDGPPVAQIECK
jgi:transcriptional regulator with XRE-family HTH domain